MRTVQSNFRNITISLYMCTEAVIRRANTQVCVYNICATKGSTYIMCYTQRNLFEIILNQAEIRLYLPFYSDLLGTKRTSVWFRINRKMVYTILFLFDSISFRKYFSVCTIWDCFCFDKSTCDWLK